MASVRRLTTILAADVAGYSRLMGADEEGTHERLKALRRELVDPKIAEHHGRIVKITGDGLLVEFASVVDAVRCAVEVQQAMPERDTGVAAESRIKLRIGINLGDVIVEADDLYGDGVNIAARIEALADAGGVFVSNTVHDHVRDRLPFLFEDLGEQKVKNIARPVRVYRVRDADAARSLLASAAPALPLPDKPSIAVLPFQNMSGDPEQEYFADGMVEEIITALSRIRWLFVIARNSSFTYKGQAVDVKRVGRELGVRYVLEGSVRKAGGRVPITGQLIDAATGTHLWADRFDGSLEDVFDLQDQVTANVVGVLAPRLEQAEISRAKRKPTESLDAYDSYLRGVAALHAVFEGNKTSVSEAVGFFDRAVRLDPEFAAAYGMAAWCYVLGKNYGWLADDVPGPGELERVARLAVRLAKDDAVALYTGGFALSRVGRDLDASAAVIDRALTFDPNLAEAWHLSGWVRLYLDEPDGAIAHFAQAMRLNPLDPLIFGVQNGTAAAHFLAGRYGEAASWAETAARVHTGYAPALRMAAASHAFAGRIEEAKKYMSLMRQIDRELRLGGVAEVAPFRRPEGVARYTEGLRLAGLPRE